MSNWVKPWLESVPWTSVVAINAALCQAKKATHKPASDGYEPTRQLWQNNYCKDLHLREVLRLCLQCHRLAPFCFYNGNTFVTIVKTTLENTLSRMPAEKAFVLRSIAGHIIAGTATQIEEKQLNRLFDELEK